MKFVERRSHERYGFTLVELSIVLVIIGLIIGGILLGKDLIHSADIRAQVSQLQQFDMAAATFKQKYGYLPGDIPNPNSLGFDHGGGVCTVLGDGNGMIKDYWGGITSTDCEPAFFFIHLYQAHLIKEIARNFSQGSYSQYVDQPFPRSKLGPYGFTVLTMPNDKLTYFFGITNNDPTLSDPYPINQTSTGPTTTPADAYALDEKMDDGIPLHGKVQATILPNTPDAVANNCLTSVAQNTYNVTKATLACNLLIQAAVH